MGIHRTLRTMIFLFSVYVHLDKVSDEFRPRAKSAFSGRCLDIRYKKPALPVSQSHQTTLYLQSTEQTLKNNSDQFQSSCLLILTQSPSLALRPGWEKASHVDFMPMARKLLRLVVVLTAFNRSRKSLQAWRSSRSVPRYSNLLCIC